MAFPRGVAMGTSLPCPRTAHSKGLSPPPRAQLQICWVGRGLWGQGPVPAAWPRERPAPASVSATRHRWPVLGSCKRVRAGPGTSSQRPPVGRGCQLGTASPRSLRGSWGSCGPGVSPRTEGTSRVTWSGPHLLRVALGRLSEGRRHPSARDGRRGRRAALEPREP